MTECNAATRREIRDFGDIHPVALLTGVSMSSMITSQLRTVQQAASDLAVSVHTVRAWIAQRRLGVVRLGRAVRVPATEIARLVERGTIPAIDERSRPVM